MNYRKSLMVAALTVAITGAVYGVYAIIGSDPGSESSEEHGRAAPGDHAADGHADTPGKKPTDHDEAAGEPHGAEDGDATGTVTLTRSQIKLAEITTTLVVAARVPVELRFTGEVKLNRERTTHIVPHLTGLVTKVNANLGAYVTANSELAVIESRELAEISAAYLTIRERTRLAQSKFERMSALWAQKISPKQDFIDAKADLAKNRVEQRAVEHRLLALGYTREQLERLVTDKRQSLTEFKVVAPFSGTVIKKHFTRGDFVEKMKPLYLITDLRKIWVIANVYERDIRKVRLGQKASVTLDSYPARKFTGDITWIAGTLDERTRSLKIRVEVDNEDRLLKPGMFARVALKIDAEDSAPVVPPSAIQRQKKETIVFVAKGNGRFQRREVKLGRRSTTAVEVREGVEIGERIVTAGSFALKSELEKRGFSGGHGD